VKHRFLHPIEIQRGFPDVGFSRDGNANAMYPRGVSGETSGGGAPRLPRPPRPATRGSDEKTTY